RVSASTPPSGARLREGRSSRWGTASVMKRGTQVRVGAFACRSRRHLDLVLAGMGSLAVGREGPSMVTRLALAPGVHLVGDCLAEGAGVVGVDADGQPDAHECRGEELGAWSDGVGVDLAVCRGLAERGFEAGA